MGDGLGDGDGDGLGEGDGLGDRDGLGEGESVGLGDGVTIEVEPVTMRVTPTCACPPLEVIAIVPA